MNPYLVGALTLSACALLYFLTAMICHTKIRVTEIQYGLWSVEGSVDRHD